MRFPRKIDYGSTSRESSKSNENENGSWRLREQWLVIRVATSKFLHGRIGALKRVPECNFDDPSSCQRSERAGTRSRGGRRPHVRVHVRPTQYVPVLLSPHLPSPRRSLVAFTFAPAATRTSPQIRGSLPFCHLSLCHLAPGKATGPGGPFTLMPGAPTCTRGDAYANGCGHIISTIDAIIARNGGSPTDAVDVATIQLSNARLVIIASPSPPLPGDISYSRRQAWPKTHK